MYSRRGLASIRRDMEESAPLGSQEVHVYLSKHTVGLTQGWTRPSIHNKSLNSHHGAVLAARPMPNLRWRMHAGVVAPRAGGEEGRWARRACTSSGYS